MLMLIVPVSWISVSAFCSGSLDGLLTTLEGNDDVTQLPGFMLQLFTNQLIVHFSCAWLKIGFVLGSHQ